jgi:plastocyanin
MAKKTAAVVAALGLAALVGASGALGHTSKTPRLNGTVGPGFTISLKKDGKKVTTLKAGKYTFVVSDRASSHNFVLERKTGGKFEKALTEVGYKGTKTVTVTLKRGKWKFYCEPHESFMFGFFKVT